MTGQSPLRVPPVSWTCGTHSKYCAGCRCDQCRAAHREHARRYRAGATKTDPKPRLFDWAAHR